MDQFTGVWKLEKNDNLEEFLYYNGYSMFGAMAALASNIDLTLTKLNDTMLTRTVDSAFMKTTEDYIFDDQFHENSEKLSKKHLFHNNMIYTTVKSTLDNPIKMNWTEIAQIVDNKLIISRTWINNGKKCTCSQTFILGPNY